MNAWETMTQWSQRFDAVWVFDALLKSLVVLGLAGSLCAILRRAAASTRYSLWFIAIAMLPVLPVLASLLPSWRQPLWRVTADRESGNRLSLRLQLAPPPSGPPVPLQRSVAAPDLPPAAPAVSSPSPPLAARFSTYWVAAGLVVWLGGVLINLFRIVVGQLRLRTLGRTSTLLTDADWLELLAELSASLDLRRPVILRQSASETMPLTWGWWRPVVLLPAGAGQWPAARRRIVLLHELAHVKRRDCLTQFIAQLVGAFYWLNPLMGLAARRLRVERELAADDMVLRGGCQPSDYASELVAIAAAFRHEPRLAAIAMARPSKLEGRITGILDATRRRQPLGRGAVAGYGLLALAVAGCLAAQKPGGESTGDPESRKLHAQHLARLKDFAAAKERQALLLAASDGVKVLPEYRRFLDAALQGDSQTVSNMYASFLWRHPQFGKDPAREDEKLQTQYWFPMHELCMAYDVVMNTEPTYLQLIADEMIKVVPPGAVYFGGTDIGRMVPTVFCKSHIDGEPFFTLTQNGLADGLYVNYLRMMYGSQIHLPTEGERNAHFQEYAREAEQRLKENHLMPGEDVKMVDGRVQVAGQVAVMSINALICRAILDQNPDREFYLEESFPLEWMYSHLEPRGLIMKLNRKPLERISENVVLQDREYWSRRVGGILGDWLKYEGSVSDVQKFVEAVYAEGNLRGYKVDPRFVGDVGAQRTFAKFRGSIGGVYGWRAQHSTDAAEKKRMIQEADFAFRQAWALSPTSVESVFRYVNLLGTERRLPDAVAIAKTANRLAPEHPQINDLLKRLEELQRSEAQTPGSPNKK